MAALQTVYFYEVWLCEYVGLQWRGMRRWYVYAREAYTSQCPSGIFSHYPNFGLVEFADCSNNQRKEARSLHHQQRTLEGLTEPELWEFAWRVLGEDFSLNDSPSTEEPESPPDDSHRPCDP